MINILFSSKLTTKKIPLFLPSRNPQLKRLNHSPTKKMNPSNKTLAIILLSSVLMAMAAPISGCGHCHRKKGKSPKRPPITGPPVLPSPPTVPGGKPGPSPSSDTCPIDALKLGACVDLLGGLVHIGLGNPVVNECCPVLQGLAEVEAAVCLCTTLKLNLLNLNIFVPIALQLLVTCGKSPPPGFTCTLSAAGPLN